MKIYIFFNIIFLKHITLIMDFNELVINLKTYILSYEKNDINISASNILKKIYHIFYNFLCKLFIDIYDKIKELEKFIESEDDLKGKFKIKMINDMEKIHKLILSKENIQLDQLHNFLQEILKYIKSKQIFDYNNQNPDKVFNKLKIIEKYLDNYNYDDINKEFEEYFKHLYLINYKRILLIKNYFNFAFDQNIIIQINKNINQILSIYTQNKSYTFQYLNNIENQIKLIKQQFLKNQLYYLNLTNKIIKKYEFSINKDNFLNDINTSKKYKFVYQFKFNLNIFMYTVYTLLQDFNKNFITIKTLKSELNNVIKCLQEYCKLYNQFYDEYIIKIDGSLIKNILKIENLEE